MNGAAMTSKNPRPIGVPATIKGKPNPEHTPVFQLTLQQQRVCELVSRGLSNKEIASEMGIGSRTVENHRLLVYRKLGVRNAVELVRKVMGATE